MNAKPQYFQDPFSNALRRDQVPVSPYSANGIRLQGRIDSFAHVALLKNVVMQMACKQATSTVVAARMVNHAALAGAGLVQ